jgi:hypothetical protein
MGTHRAGDGMVIRQPAFQIQEKKIIQGNVGGEIEQLPQIRA